MKASPTLFGDRRMLIDGRMIESSNGSWIESINPATEEILGRVPAASLDDVNTAVMAADRAWPAWAGLAVEKRGLYLRKLADMLETRADELVNMEVLDTGITISKIRADIGSACRMLRYYAGLGLELKGESVPATPNNIHFSLREPYGVVGRIIPFNHPLQFAASKIAAPLIAGNAVVLKPSEQSPLTATVLAELCAEIFPPGVINIVTGLADAGVALTRHPSVRRLALIGSPQTGMAMQRAAAETGVKHITLELGGKNPSIVFPDADLALVTDAAIAGMNFGHQGQSCGSLSRLFLHDSLYDRVLADVVKRVEALRVGDPMDPHTQMGAMNSQQQYERVLHYIRAGLEDGASLVAGGSRPSGKKFEKGYWIQPTVFADVTPEMRIFREEIFGPVLSVIRWSETDDVIRMANSTQYGLTAAIWTQDIRTAFQTARRIQSGYISINGRPGHFPGVSFGGVKNSGLGTEEGFDEVLSYTVPKVINIILPVDNHHALNTSKPQ